MKIKQAPGDFVVEEILGRTVAGHGPFTLYRLRKRGIGTIEALKLIASAWRIAPRDVSFAGLKDRYGDTVQWIAAWGGPERSYRGRGFELEPSGYTDRPLDRSDVQGNRFRLLLRDLSQREAERARERAAQVATWGFANYFDDQRFGSMRATPGRLVVGAWLRGQAEEALRLAIAAPSHQDRSRIKARRRLLQERWGHWEELAQRIDPSPEQRICQNLARGASYEDAYGKLDRSLRSLHASAWQAWVFNAGLRRAIGAGPTARGIGQPYIFYPEAPGELATLQIPLASRRAEEHPLLDGALEEEGVSRERLSLIDLRRGLRPAVAWPQALEVGTVQSDARNAGRRMLSLAFTLGRGSYATMLIKRLGFDARGR